MGPIPMKKFRIDFLPNGLPICRVLVINPYDENDTQLETLALIDTGSDCSIISQKLFKMFSNIDNSEMLKIKMANVTDVVNEVIGYNFQIRVPLENRLSIVCPLFIREMNREYDIILGVDFLKSHAIEFDFKNRIAILKF